MDFFGISKWGIRSNVTSHHAPETVKFPTKSSETVALADLVASAGDFKDKSTFYAHPSVFNGTLQTMFLNSKLNRPELHHVCYGRRIFKFKDEGIASVDYLLPTPNTKEEKEDFAKAAAAGLVGKEHWPRQNNGTRFLSDEEVAQKTKPDPNDDSSVLIVLHALGGGSHEPLIKDLVSRVGATESFKEVVVLNTRGCSRSKITTPYLFCGFSTDDLRELIQEINANFPKRKIFLAGYSFGTTTLMNYLSEECKALHKANKSTSQTPNNIQLAVCVGAPWDFVDSMYHLGSSSSGQRLFEPALLSFLTRIVKNNRAELKHQWPHVDFSDKKLKSLKKMVDFDNTYTAKMFNFNSGAEYYRKVSPVNNVNHYRVPMIIVNSTDDPCVSVHLPLIEIESNPYLIQIETDLGGHLGYIDTKSESWVNKQIVSLFKKFIETVDFEAPIDNLGYEPKANIFGV